MDFFGTPWDDLTLAHVEAFLGGEIDEGITWETKGTKRPTRHQVRKAVNGLANQQGGFFLIGVGQGDSPGAWVADGVDFDGNEPTRSLSDVIAGGLDPVPTFDVKPFVVDEGRYVAVVMVEPVAVPPCVTIAGQIYERLPGKTEPVTATTLARLRGRGNHAMGFAESTADESTTGRAYVIPDAPYLFLSLGVAPTGRAADIGGLLFTQTFERELKAVYEELPVAPLLGRSRHRYAYDTEMIGSRFIATPVEAANERWTIHSGWNGSIALFLDVIGDGETESLLAKALFRIPQRLGRGQTTKATCRVSGLSECNGTSSVCAESRHTSRNCHLRTHRGVALPARIRPGGSRPPKPEPS